MRLFHAGLDRPNLQLAAREVWGDDEKLAAILELEQRHLGLGATGSGIVSFTLIRVLERFSAAAKPKQNCWNTFALTVPRGANMSSHRLSASSIRPRWVYSPPVVDPLINKSNHEI